MFHSTLSPEPIGLHPDSELNTQLMSCSREEMSEFLDETALMLKLQLSLVAMGLKPMSWDNPKD